ncbi:MAG: hypothetical protein GQ574_08905 [Crocinitomix sp.]|nr:hypothetical protein [Crocinitomix sp.]
MKKNDSFDRLTSIIVPTVTVAFSIMVGMFFSFVLDMCVSYDREILYEHKYDPNTKIIVREFGCGATDSGPPSVGIYEVSYFTSYFIRSAKIDTNEIDKSNWLRIQDN